MANAPSLKILKESASRFGATNIAGGSIKAACDSLHEFFVGEFGEANLANCPVCKLDGPEKDKEGNLLTNCPYCGAKFVDAPAVEAPKGKTDGAAVPKIAKKKGADKEIEPAYVATEEQKEELSAHVEKINELRTGVAQNSFDIGVELNQINDKGLWKGLGYGSFFEYTTAELDFSRASVYKYMLTSREFDRETFLQIGVKKAELIAAAPEKHQKVLTKSALKGKSFTELRDQLDKLEGRTPRTSGAGKGSDRVTLLGHVKKGENIEVAWLSGASHEPVTTKGVKNRYAKIKLTDEVELVLIPNENDLGMIATFRKIGEAPKTEAEETKAEGEAPATEPETKVESVPNPPVEKKTRATAETSAE